MKSKSAIGKQLGVVVGVVVVVGEVEGDVVCVVVADVTHPICCASRMDPTNEIACISSFTLLQPSRRAPSRPVAVRASVLACSSVGLLRGNPISKEIRYTEFDGYGWVPRAVTRSA
jgi:DNA helicase HerA-like ATPase